MAKTDYKVLKGIDYPPNKRAEAGAIVSDLPKESISWLLASGIITDDLKKEVSAQIILEPVDEVIEEDVLDDTLVGDDSAV